ncbi:MAG TPA: OsmC family protein [Gammaproteobacteria bacterium]|nr:OsmC family protein [Gammaproteobacteria bacterium]
MPPAMFARAGITPDSTRRYNPEKRIGRKPMSEIPLRYETGYTWTGTAMAGNTRIADHPPLPVGSPRDADRFCPEHLLVATVEACLANYILLFAQHSGLEVHAYHSSASGELEQPDTGGYRFRRIVVRPVLRVPETSASLAGRIVEKAHSSCLVARSLNCAVEIEPTIET